MLTKLWRAIKFLTALALVLALVALVLWHTWASGRLGRWVHEKLQAALPHLRVELGAVRLEGGQKLILDHLALWDPQFSPAPLLEVEELELWTRWNLAQWDRGPLVVEKVVVRRARVRVLRDRQGRWHLGALWPPPALAARTSCQGNIQDALVLLVDQGTGETLQELGRLEAQFIKYRPGNQRPPWQVQGQLVGQKLGRVQFHWAGDPRAPWSLQAQWVQMELDSQWAALLPLPAGRAEDWGQWNCRVRGSLQVEKRPDPQAPWNWKLQAQLTHGTLDHRRLPYPLREISGQVVCTPQRLELSGFRTRSRHTRMALSGQFQLADWERPAGTIQLEVSRLLVNQQLLKLLPGELSGLWERFRPQGEVDLQAQVAWEQGRMRVSQATVHALGLSFTYHRLPYPVHKATGTLVLQGEQLQLELQGLAGGRPLWVRAQVENPGPQFTGWVQVQGSRLPVDQTLLQALPSKPRAVVQSLHPQGVVSFACKFWRDHPSEKLQRHITVEVQQGAIRYEKFPYRVENIRGTLELVNHRWQFRRLQGSHGRCRITAEGALGLDPDSGQLELRLTGLALPLDEELRAALPPGVQRFWDQLHPQGMADITAQVRWPLKTKKLDLLVQLEPVGQSVSIEPEQFRYRLAGLRGRITYRNGRVEFSRLRARHERMLLQAQGYALLGPDGSWRLELQPLVAQQVMLDRHLQRALPSALRQVATTLRPNRPFVLQGKLLLEHRPQSPHPWQAQWDLEFLLQQMDLHVGVKVEDVYGSVRLQGAWDGRQLECQGQLDLECLFYRGWQFTQVRGPFRVGRDRIYLGAAQAPRMQPGKLPHLTARFYDGQLWADAWVLWHPQVRYSLRAQVQEASLGRLAREVLPTRQPLSGKLNAVVQLQGQGAQLATLRGLGTLHLQEADIYQLPLMVAMLKVLRLRLPSATAFTNSHIRFRIQGSHIYLDRIDFNGDAVSLLGAGEVGLDRQVRLVFRAEVGRSDRRLPVVGPLLGAASQQIVRLYVDGPWDNPRVRTEPFPGVNDTLRRIQAQLDARIPPPAQGAKPRPVLPRLRY